MRKRPLPWLILAIGVALLLWRACGDFAPTAVPTPPDSAPGEAARTVAQVETTNAQSGQPTSTEVVPERRSAEVTPWDSALAVLFGRCVDRTGAPLADCKVRLRGWSAGSEREAEWLRDNALLPEALDLPPATTGSDGRFRFSFAPPAPFQFALEVQCDGLVSVDGRWQRLAAGSTTDVGDVVMQAGVRVVGRVVDEFGRGIGDATVMLDQQKDVTMLTARRGPLTPKWGEGMITEADGSFRTNGWLRPGNYRVSAADTLDVTPQVVTLPEGVGEHSLTIVLKLPPRMPTIAGRVVDELGKPVAEARIECRSAPRGMPSTRTSREGRFVLSATADSPERSILAVEAEGFEPYRTTEPIAWNTAGVELRLTRSAALTVRVVDLAGAAVPEYTVRTVPRAAGRWTGHDAEVRARGPFAAGTAVVHGLRTGQYLAILEFPTQSGLATLYEPFAMQGPMRLDLRAAPPTERIARIVDAAGQPVAGARIQLCEMFGGGFEVRRQVLGRDLWLRNTLGDHVLAVCEVTTGTDGRAPLAAAAGKSYGLALPGPGHTPLTLPEVRLDALGELVIPVNRGARMFGTLAPAEAVTHLLRFGAAVRPADRLALAFSGRRGARFPNTPPGTDPASTSTAIAEDGTFDVRGIPAGTWRVELRYLDGPNANELYSRTHSLGSVTLADGDNGPLTLDIESLLPGTLVARVLENGLPMANANLGLSSPGHQSPVQTDAEGRFRIELPAGEYQLKSGGMTSLVAEGSASIRRGLVAEQTFEFASASFTLRVADANGKPAVGALLRFEPDRQLYTVAAADGTLACKMPPGSYRIRVLRSSMSSDEALHKLTVEGMQKQLDDPFAPHLLDVQPLELTRGSHQEIRLVLPAAWNH